MKFYDCRTAPSPRRVRIFAAEKGIELDTVQVDLASGEQFGDAFRALNPDCVVPVLQLDDGTLITEVLAICQYLEELHPEPALIGATAAERAKSVMWATKVEQQGLVAARDAFRNSAKGLKAMRLPALHSMNRFQRLRSAACSSLGSSSRDSNCNCPGTSTLQAAFTPSRISPPWFLSTFQPGSK